VSTDVGGATCHECRSRHNCEAVCTRAFNHAQPNARCVAPTYMTWFPLSARAHSPATPLHCAPLASLCCARVAVAGRETREANTGIAVWYFNRGTARHAHTMQSRVVHMEARAVSPCALFCVVACAAAALFWAFASGTVVTSLAAVAFSCTKHFTGTQLVLILSHMRETLMLPLHTDASVLDAAAPH
jgi:hypothetical protein